MNTWSDEEFKAMFISPLIGLMKKILKKFANIPSHLKHFYNKYQLQVIVASVFVAIIIISSFNIVATITLPIIFIAIIIIGDMRDAPYNPHSNESMVETIASTFNGSKMAMLENQKCADIPDVEVKDLPYGVGGTCSPDGTITLTKKRMSREERRKILIHEMAHKIDFHIRGFSCHDTYWDKIHRSCGGSGSYLEDDHEV